MKKLNENRKSKFYKGLESCHARVNCKNKSEGEGSPALKLGSTAQSNAI